MPSPRRRVFLVEDHQVIRAAIVTLIRSQDDLDVCGTATSAEEALQRLPCDADLVLVDVSLPGMSGIDFIREARTRWPDLVYVILSGHSEERYGVPARAVGAADYVMKGDAAALINAITDAFASGRGSSGHGAADTPAGPGSTGG